MTRQDTHLSTIQYEALLCGFEVWAGDGSSGQHGQPLASCEDGGICRHDISRTTILRHRLI